MIGVSTKSGSTTSPAISNTCGSRPRPRWCVRAGDRRVDRSHRFRDFESEERWFAFNKRPASRLLTSACGPCPKPLEGPNESSCVILTQIGGTSAIPFRASIEQFYCSNRAARRWRSLSCCRPAATRLTNSARTIPLPSPSRCCQRSKGIRLAFRSAPATE
jgi:hypothetical protein